MYCFFFIIIERRLHEKIPEQLKYKHELWLKELNGNCHWMKRRKMENKRYQGTKNRILQLKIFMEM